MKASSMKVSALLLLSLAAGSAFAQQPDCNLYPYADGAVYDNNGHDLAGFAKIYKKEVASKASKIESFSGGEWGYVQIDNERVPSLQKTPGRDGRILVNYSEYLNTTVALFNTRDGIEGTWWTRQCNNPEGPLYYKKVGAGNLDIPVVRYTELQNTMDLKKFTIVEYNDSVFNSRDFDIFLKNHIITENGLVKNFDDYRSIISYFNNFLSKFTYVDDPLLGKTSFITFLVANGTRYVCYFNIVNGRLSGHLALADFQYEADLEPFVANLMRKLSGNTVYVYGNSIFGLEKTFLKYKHDHHELTFVRMRADGNEKINK